MKHPSESSLLVVFALEAEARGLFFDLNTAFCGVGKINAAYNLTNTLVNWEKRYGAPPALVVNAGSAGSCSFPEGTIVNCTQFVQRDMDATALGFAKFETPFDESPAQLANGLRCDIFPEGLCGTGDSFATDGEKAPWTVIDMEAYALAKVCHLRSQPFCCLKYITDSADNDAARSWEENLHLAATKLREAVDRLKTL